MGNVNTSNLLKQGQFLKLSTKFQILKYDTDRHCLFVSDKKTHEQFIFKEVIIKDINEKQWVERLCKQKIEYGSDNMMKIKLYGFEKEKSSFKGYFLFEKPYKDLRSQSLTRHGLKMIFSDRQLLIIIQGVVKSLKWLKSMNHIHNSVCTTNIFISKSGTISLSDPCLNTQLNAYYRSKNRIYYSPQRLKDQKNVQDLFASDLFSLGMSIMQLIFMSSMEDMYTRYNTIDFKLLSLKTYQIRNQKLRRYIEGLLHPIEQKRVAIANQIDSQIKIVSVTLKNTDFLISKKQHTKTSSNKKPLKLYNKQLYTIQNYLQPVSTFQQFENNSLLQKTKKPNFKRKKCFSQSSINKQNYHSTLQRSNKKSSIEQYTPSKQYETLRQRQIYLQHPLNNYSSYRMSKVSARQKLSSNKKLIHQLSEQSFRKCRTQRNEQLFNNILTSQFKPQHFKTQVEQQYFVFHKEEYQNNSIQHNKKSNKFISTSQIFKKNKPIQPNFFTLKNQFKKKKLQQNKFENQIKQINVKIDTEAINLSDFIKKQPVQTNDYLYKSQKVTNKPLSPITQTIDISDSVQKQILEYNSSSVQKQQNTKSPLKQQQQILCEFNNSKTITFQKILAKKSQTVSSLKQQTPFIKSISRRLSLFKSQILDEQMTPKKKQHNIENSTIKQQSESGLSSVTVNCHQFVIEKMNGGRYEGQKQNGQRNGIGIFYYDDGGYYDGEWKDDCMHGSGKLYYNSQGLLAYQGEFFANQFHGKGKVFNDQMVHLQSSFNYQDFNQVEQYWFSYEGYFQCDTRNGVGKLKLTNGQIFEGQFKNDQIEGQGRFYTRTGQLILGTWKDSKLISLNN